MPAIIGPLFDVLIPKPRRPVLADLRAHALVGHAALFLVFARVRLCGIAELVAGRADHVRGRHGHGGVAEHHAHGAGELQRELICAALPVAPASATTFVIEKGCARTFNACAARRNVENFGGFTRCRMNGGEVGRT